MLLFFPEINASGFTEAGKNIKATRFTTEVDRYCHPDSLIVPEITPNIKGSYKIRTVVIDPGHGGHDPGCSGANSREKHNCLAIGKYLSEALKLNYPSLNVIMTRSTDVFIPLNERATIATRNQADLFISIHCNFIPKASHIHGSETYVLGLHATKENLEVAKRENASILYEENYQETYGYDPNSPEAHIMFSMFQNAYLEQSILFAQKVQQNLSGEAGRKDKGVKQAGFLVLRHATMPSVLVETGYLSNRQEEDFIRSKKGQTAIANALLLAFNEYKAEAEGIDRLLAVKKLDNDVRDDFTAEFVTEEVTLPATANVEKAKTPEQQTFSSRENASDKRPDTSVRYQEVNMPSTEVTSSVNSKPLLSSPVSVQVPSSSGSKIIPSNPVVTSSEPPVSQTGTRPGQTEKISKPENISAAATSSKSSLSVSQNIDIQFRVQLAASPSLLDMGQGKWKQVDFLIEVVEEDRLYKYQVRNFATLGEASQAKQKLRALGFSDAFVIAYQNGQRVDPRMLKE